MSVLSYSGNCVKSFLLINGFGSKNQKKKRKEERENFVKKLSEDDAKQYIELMRGIYPSREEWNKSNDFFRKLIEEEREKTKDIDGILGNDPLKLEFYEIGHINGFKRGYSWGEFGWRASLSKDEYKKNISAGKIISYASLISAVGLFYFATSMIFTLFGTAIKLNSLEERVYKEGVRETKEFYQENGVCPTDSTSQDFVEWKELWNENFPKIK